MQDQKEVYVYIIKDGKATKTPVHISSQTNDYAVIDKGLKNGDKIIVDNFKKIRQGSEVMEIRSK